MGAATVKNCKTLITFSLEVVQRSTRGMHRVSRLGTRGFFLVPSFLSFRPKGGTCFSLVPRQRGCPGLETRETRGTRIFVVQTKQPAVSSLGGDLSHPPAQKTALSGSLRESHNHCSADCVNFTAHRFVPQLASLESVLK